MITASHNPKQDNGYKLYWGNGAQIIPPHDLGIAQSIQSNLEPWQVWCAWLGYELKYVFKGVIKKSMIKILKIPFYYILIHYQAYAYSDEAILTHALTENVTNVS